jgi:alpha-L-fucosidase
MIAILSALVATTPTGMSPAVTVQETADEIRIGTPTLEAGIRKNGYVSGVYGGTFVDKKTGFRDAGFGLDIVDWVMEPGSDQAYRDRLPKDMVYEYNNPWHGKTAKRCIEGPQICTQAKELTPEVIQGKEFIAVKSRYRYHLAAPGKQAGSEWEQTLVFPQGKRYFLSCDRVTSANDGDATFLRIDMPGHIKHTNGDTFSEVYLSYAGRIPTSEFLKDFAPDEKFIYRRTAGRTPKRFIRAYHLRDPKTGKDGPWLAGMTLDPSVVSEAWCHQRDYVCMIEEFGGRPIKRGQTLSAAFLVGYFDSIEEMNRTYDQYAGNNTLAADASGWRIGKDAANAAAAVSEEEERLAKRLEWFQDQKFGLMMHWAPYSQWGCIESWPLVEEDKWARPDDLPAWVERGKDIERFKADYWKLPKTFNPTKFDPKKWAAAAKQAGMKYVVFTTKHHDGFSMFDTKLTDYRITGPESPFRNDPWADVVREVFNAFRAAGMGIGAYFSKADWHHPDYWSPDAPARTRNPNYDTRALPEKWNRFVEFVHGQIKELVTGYGPVDILWLDAGQVRPPQQDIRMDELVAMARSHQPNLIIVDRTVGGKHENYRTPEQEVPEKPLEFVWESCITMGKQWSYKPDDQYKSTRDLIHLLVDVVAKGGNLLLNIGPQPDGELPAVAVSRLKEIGQWMEVNGEAIHGTRAVAPYKRGNVAFTKKGRALYAIYLPAAEEGLPAKITLAGIRLEPGTKVRLLGAKGVVSWQPSGEDVVVTVPEGAVKSPPCRHAFVFKLSPVD